MMRRLEYTKKELDKRTKGNLINIIIGLHANEGNFRKLLTEYKVTILFFKRKLSLVETKLRIWETARDKRTYRDIGAKHNRNITTSKQAHNRRKLK